MKRLNSRLATAASLAGVVGVVLTPVLVGAAPTSNSTNTVVNANVGSAISISSTGSISVSVTPTVTGAQSSTNDTVTVNTNDSTGYHLTINDADSNTNLVNGAYNIAAHTGTVASPTALASNTWGFALGSGTTGSTTTGFDPTATYSTPLVNASSSTSKWAGVTTTAAEIKRTSTSASNDTTTVYYSAKVDTSIANGTYTDTVTYTATTNS